MTSPFRLPLLVSVAFAAAVAIGATPPRVSEPPGFVEMEVAGVFELEGGAAAMLVLRHKGAETLVPVVVGSAEGDAIQMRLEGKTPSRPRSHELLEQAIAALGGRVLRIEIHDASEALYRARVHLAQGAKHVELDARPSDAVALALGLGAPIFATRELVTESGLTREDLERMQRPDERRDETVALEEPIDM